MKTKKSIFLDKKFILGIFILLALAAISIMTGAYNIRSQEDGLRMVFITRLPRTLALMLTGLALSLSGLVMQLITQNRMVEPTTTGTIEWASLGLILVYILIPSPTLVQRMLGAIVFSFLGSMIFFLLLRKIKLKSSLYVPILGIMLGGVVNAITTFVSLEFNMMQALEIYFQGSFASVQRGRYEFLYLIVIISIAIFFYADRLTMAGLGEDFATNIGLNYKAIILMANFLVSLAVGIVAAVIGRIPFLGLIVPNIVSLRKGDNLRENLPWTALCSMGVILFADILSRTIIAPFEVPVSLILGSFGSIFFVFLLLRTRRVR